MEIVSNQEVQGAQPMGVGKRFINIIFDPKAVFSSIIGAPKILIPIVFILVSLLLLAIPKAPLAEDYTRESMEKIYKNEKFLMTQQITTDSANKLIEKQTQNAQRNAYLGFILFPAIALLIKAGIFHGLFKLIGGVGTFVQTLAVCLYSYIIQVIGEAVRTVNVLISGNYESVNSLGLIMQNDKTSYLYNFINFLDFFSVWSIILVAVGLSIVHKVSQKKSYIWALSLWMLYIVFLVVSTTLQASMLYEKFGIIL